MSLKNPYAHFLDQLEKPARYIGGEHFINRKDWSQAKAKVALCFPDTYEIGMSHLGMKILYEEINRHPDLLAERCFCPWLDMEKEMRQRELPLVTLENFKPLKDFDVVGFSLQYEMSYTNILNMLNLGQIPIWQKDRNDHDPFVICGGPGATHPEPLAPFMDFVVVGDGERLFAKIVHFIGEARLNNYSRHQILLELASWDGIYVPSFYDTALCERSGLEYVSGAKAEYASRVPAKIKRYFIESLKDYPFPTRSPIPHLTAIFDRFSVELARGCTEGCRFCQAGMIYRPVRERKPENVINMVMDGLKNGGFDEASLTCLSTADYSAVTPLVVDLLDKLAADNSTLGISSLRAYGLDTKILDKLVEVKNTSLTFAPEAGSQRMRDVINKNVTEEHLMQTAEDVFSRGWKKMKLYFMIGLPTEEDEDVAAIMETARKAREIAQKKCGVRNPNITVSVSSFVPKPHTPFQWASMITLSEIERKQNFLFKLSRDYKLNFRKHFSKISYFEGIVSRGDRRVANIIYRAWEKGARFDGWDESFDYQLWLSCVEESGLDVSLFLGTIPLDGKLPWDHIDVGLKERFLELEWKKATMNRLSPPCGKVYGAIVHHSNLEELEKTFDIDKKKLVCYHCGVACDLKEMVSERRDFLTSMKAFKPEVYQRPANQDKSIVERREKRGHNVGVKYRIEFSKIGALSFISHLDLQKVIARIFKRAEIEILRSEGFRPRPLISFGPALSLGICSLSEFFDVRVAHDWGSEEVILEKLQQHSEPGLIFKSAIMVSTKEDSIQVATKKMSYFLPITSGEINQLAAVINNSDQLMVETYQHKAKKVIQKDLKLLIEACHVGELKLDESIINELDQVSPCKNLTGLFINTLVQDGKTIRPSDLVELASKYGNEAHRPIKVETVLSSECE
jgi:radical SAM family uncharacterized protein/radical SAM-linked protein